MTPNTKNIPVGWQQTTVDKVLIRYFTGPSPTCEERNISNTDEWGVLKTTAVTWEGWNLLAHKTLPEKYWGLSNLEIRSGDVLITKAGPRHRCGVVVFVDRTIPHLIVSGKMIGLRPDTKKVLPLILSLALAQSDPQKYLDIRTTGMAESQLNFTNENFLKTPIIIPSLPEQNAILNIWSSLDKAIKKTDQLIGKYKSIKQGLMQNLFRYGIDDKEQIRSEKTHFFKDSPLGRIPEEWDTDVLGKKSTITYGVNSAIDYDQKSGIKTITLPCVSSDGKLELNDQLIVFSKESITKGLILKRCDLLFNWRNGSRDHLGKTVYFDSNELYTHVGFLLRIRIKIGLNPKFLYYFINYLKSIGFFLTAKIQVNNTFNSAELRRLMIAVPLDAEQIRIANSLTTIDNYIKVEETQKNKLLSIKRGLMSDLLSGKVRVDKLAN